MTADRPCRTRKSSVSSIFCRPGARSVNRPAKLRSRVNVRTLVGPVSTGACLVAEDVKQRRLAEVIDAFRTTAGERQKEEIGRVHLVLVEGPSKKNERELTGKTDSSKWAIFADTPVGIYGGDEDELSLIHI